MGTRSSDHWNELPGSFDKLHTSIIYPSLDRYDIPLMRRATRVPKWLHPYGIRVYSDQLPEGAAVHFFLDDRRFEALWTHYVKSLPRVRAFGLALSPEFSCYRDWPIATQIYNTYRNRWLGRYWQDDGVEVIPSICWNNEASYDFAFAGIQRGSVVAVSSLGVKTAEDWADLQNGYEEMVRRIDPPHVVYYGTAIPDALKRLAPVTCYPTYWQGVRAVRRKLREAEQGQFRPAGAPSVVVQLPEGVTRRPDPSELLSPVTFNPWD